MKRYICFHTVNYIEARHMLDFIGDFDCLETAIEYVKFYDMEEYPNTELFDGNEGSIFDMEKMEVAWVSWNPSWDVGTSIYDLDNDGKTLDRMRRFEYLNKFKEADKHLSFNIEVCGINIVKDPYSHRGKFKYTFIVDEDSYMEIAINKKSFINADERFAYIQSEFKRLYESLLGKNNH